MYPKKVKINNHKVINFEIVVEWINFFCSWIKSLKNPSAMILFLIKSFYF